MPDNNDVSNVNVTDDGDPMTGVHVFQPFIARISRPGVIFGLVMTGMLAMLSMTILVVYLAPSVDRLTEGQDKAAAEREELISTVVSLQRELDTILTDQRNERLTDDCLTSYLSDIEVAKGVASVTLGDNLATAILTDDPNDNARLAQEVFDANAGLRNALAALEAYLLIDPPLDECPHP